MSKQGSGSMSRRSALKMLSAVGASAAASAGVTATDGSVRVADRDTFDPYPDDKPLKYHESLRRVTNEPYLLSLPSESIDRHFDSSDLEGREFERTRTWVRNLRMRYPTERVEGRHFEWVTLTDEAVRTLERTDRRQRTLVGQNSDVETLDQPDEGGLPSIQSEADVQARRNVLEMYAGPEGDGARAMWDPSHHERILQQALDDVDSDADMAQWAGVPDSFNQMANGRLGLQDGDLDLDIPDVPFVPEDEIADFAASALKSAIDRVFKNYTQYYDPDVFNFSIPHIGQIEIDNLGMAPHASEAFRGAAAGTYDDEQERRYLAYSTHYLHDMAVPLHTGMGLEQAGLDIQFDPLGGNFSFDLNPKKWLHFGFEGLVRDNWGGNRSFVDDFSGTDTAWPNSFLGTVRMSQVSSTYSDDIFNEILKNENPPNNRNSPYWRDWNGATKDRLLRNIDTCFSSLGSYNRGYLTEMDYGDTPDCPPWGCWP